MKKAVAWILKRQGKKGVSYCVRWIEPVGGKCRGKTFSRSVDALAFKAKIQSDLASGDYEGAVRIGFEVWKEQHLVNMRKSLNNDISPATISSQAEALAVLARVCKPKYLGDITPAMIRAFGRTLAEEGRYSYFTINKWIRTIRSALSYAVRDGYLRTNKLLGPQRLCLRVVHKTPHTLQAGEVATLFKYAGDMQTKAVISLSYYHGLRRGEICFLEWQDVDFEQRRLTIADRASHRTKTRRSRVVALRSETAELLQRLSQDRVNGYVFTNPKTTDWGIGKRLKRLSTETGIVFTLHDLRRTCNTLLKESGASLEVAMGILGHSEQRTNLVYYTGAMPEQQRQAIDGLPGIG